MNIGRIQTFLPYAGRRNQVNRNTSFKCNYETSDELNGDYIDLSADSCYDENFLRTREKMLDKFKVRFDNDSCACTRKKFNIIKKTLTPLNLELADIIISDNKFPLKKAVEIITHTNVSDDLNPKEAEKLVKTLKEVYYKDKTSQKPFNMAFLALYFKSIENEHLWRGLKD